MNHDIFISYSHLQKSIADGVCHYLEENGFRCWMAPRDIPVGSEYGDLIEEAIKKSKAVVLVFSEAASISKWVKGEINVAFTEDKTILPFRVDETEIKGGFRVMLNQMHWIDAFPQYADKLPDLLKSISGLLVGFAISDYFNEQQSIVAEQRITKYATIEAKTLKENLLNDMRGVYDCWNYMYKSNVMRILFGRVAPTDEMRSDPSPAGRFMKAGLELTMEDLYSAGILPRGNHELERAIFREEFEVPQLTLEEIGTLYPDRTDVYFLGLPPSGKSCIFACLAKYFHDHGVVYEPHFNDVGVDNCFAYYQACIEGLSSCDAPRSTGYETLSFLQITSDNKKHKRNKLTIIESSGDPIKEQSFKQNMEKHGVGRCLKNNNPKALFLLLDYSFIMEKNPLFSRMKQELFIERLIHDFSSDGRGMYGEKGCVMSKVKTLGIIITKSDLMDVEAHRSLSAEERMNIASNYLENCLSGIMNNLRALCKKYRINEDIEGHVYEPYVITFSTGMFYVGNSVVYDETDTNRLATFILNEV